jgi:hypothetical protein
LSISVINVPASDAAFDYPGDIVWRPSAAGLLPVSLAGCLQTVDLRVPPGDHDSVAVCAVGERINPDTDACAPCVALDPDALCPCGYDAAPAPFPACAGPFGEVSCHGPCVGDVTACSGVTERDGSWLARDCGLLRDCCGDLAVDPLSTTCCAADESLLCLSGTGELPYPFIFLCIGTSCCATSCDTSSDCDTSFQTCKDDRCVPGCDIAREFCLDDGFQCECRPSSPQ